MRKRNILVAGKERVDGIARIEECCTSLLGKVSVVLWGISGEVFFDDGAHVKGSVCENIRIEFCANVVRYTLHDEGDGERLICGMRDCFGGVNGGRWVAENVVLNAKCCGYDDERVLPATEIVAPKALDLKLGLHGVCDG